MRARGDDQLHESMKKLDPADRKRIRMRTLILVGITVRKALRLLDPADREPFLADLLDEVRRG